MIDNNGEEIPQIEINLEHYWGVFVDTNCFAIFKDENEAEDYARERLTLFNWQILEIGRKKSYEVYYAGKLEATFYERRLAQAWVEIFVPTQDERNKYRIVEIGGRKRDDGAKQITTILGEPDESLAVCGRCGGEESEDNG